MIAPEGLKSGSGVSAKAFRSLPPATLAPWSGLGGGRTYRARPLTSTIEHFDKAIISRQPDFDERKTRAEFRKVIPNVKTIVVHCFDPRVTAGIPHAVAKVPVCCDSDTIFLPCNSDP